MTDKKKVMVVGATGKTGRLVVKKLKEYGNYEPVALVRQADQKTYFDELGVETIVGDLTSSMDGIFEGIDKVIYTAGVKPETLPERLWMVEREGFVKAADAADYAGVTKFIMLSAMGADDPSSGDGIHNFLKAKHDAEKHLHQIRMNYAIVRVGKLTDEPGTGRVQIAPRLETDGIISREDTADVLIECLDNIKTENRIIEISAGDKPIRKEILEYRPNEL